MLTRLTTHAAATLAALLFLVLPCAAQGDKPEPAAIQFAGALEFHDQYPDAHYHLARTLDELGRDAMTIETLAGILVGATLLLASANAGSFITGIELIVDGGYAAMTI